MFLERNTVEVVLPFWNSLANACMQLSITNEETAAGNSNGRTKQFDKYLGLLPLKFNIICLVLCIIKSWNS